MAYVELMKFTRPACREQHLVRVQKCLNLEKFSQRPLRISAFSAVNSIENAEHAEIRRERRE